MRRTNICLAEASADLEGDLAAIRDSFGVLDDEDVAVASGPDERALHLERVARL